MPYIKDSLRPYPSQDYVDQLVYLNHLQAVNEADRQAQHEENRQAQQSHNY